ncbi:helix-turn-helix domain-containing protein [Nocardia sp. NPDC050378]|uniref:helix-turn-helix domain-containing protein n=1 Tax=Nocardia sp. NPDC050378 TaxID=3155400 RepID=UPI0033C59839
MCTVLSDHGVDPVPLLRAARIPVDVLEVPDRRIGWLQELAFQEVFAQRTAEQIDIWLETGTRYLYPVFEAFGAAMISAPTLRHFRDLVTTLETFYSVGRYRSIDIGEDWAGIEVELPPELDPSGVFFRFTVVRDVAAIAAFLDDLWRGPFPLEHLELPLDPVPVAVHDLVHSPIVSGSAAVRWIWPSGLLDVPLPRSNAMLYHLHVKRAACSATWLQASAQLDEQVSAILARPGNAGLSLARLAAELAMSVRTLQRRLDEYEVSFRSLRDQARLREACRLLSETDVSVSEISDQLAYVEVASFSNAFRRWTGESPSRYRLRYRRQADDSQGGF